MSPNPDRPTTLVLFIDDSKDHCTYWADQLKRCSSDYEIVEASDAQSGLDLYRSRRIDCLVPEISLPDQWCFKALVELVPVVSRPKIAVVLLTLLTHPGVWRLAKENGAYACLVKDYTSGDDLDRAIRRAIAFVGHMPKEDRYRAI